jgi:uncharacterized protein (TIGR00255 family)
MNSMTGFGRGETLYNGHKITTEVSSVNRRQLEIEADLPEMLRILEPRIRETVAKYISRGRITVRIRTEPIDMVQSTIVRANVTAAKRCLQELHKLITELDLHTEIQLDHLLRIPGVIELTRAELDPAALWPGLQKSLGLALKALVEMRAREGQHLKADLKKRIAIMQRNHNAIKKRAPLVVEHYKKRLWEKLQAAQVTITNEDRDRLTRELVLFADRCDITEELTRLQSHFNQFIKLLDTEKPVGRTLDFLCQEMVREINTIGAKANDLLISQHVVSLKSELEKIREQVQNIE